VTIPNRWPNQIMLAPAIVQAADTAQLPRALLLALVGIESGFRPDAKRGEPQIGDASWGLTQILYSTAQGEGYTGPAEGLLDIGTNLQYGASYLRRLLKARGFRVTDALSNYNGGFRPSLGFGTPATEPVSVCLRWEIIAGKRQCADRRWVQAGEYGNQEYVDKVMEAARYFEEWLAQVPDYKPGGVPLDDPQAGGSTLSALLGLLAAGLLGWALWKAL